MTNYFSPTFSKLITLNGFSFKTQIISTLTVDLKQILCSLVPYKAAIYVYLDNSGQTRFVDFLVLQMTKIV